MLVSQKHNTKCADSMAQKDHSALEKSQGHGNAKIVVFRLRGTFWQEYFVDRRYMRQVIFQGLYFEKIKGHGFRGRFKNVSKHICFGTFCLSCTKAQCLSLTKAQCLGLKQWTMSWF